ncbi:MAG: hypothetical protein H0W27_04815 [Actinobacteria bacterium]|nr:hypothetical protein [Actinomycetota bacterium]
MERRCLMGGRFVDDAVVDEDADFRRQLCPAGRQMGQPLVGVPLRAVDRLRRITSPTGVGEADVHLGDPDVPATLLKTVPPFPADDRAGVWQ